MDDFVDDSVDDFEDDSVDSFAHNSADDFADDSVDDFVDDSLESAVVVRDTLRGGFEKAGFDFFEGIEMVGYEK